MFAIWRGGWVCQAAVGIYEGGEALAQAAQSSCGCPLPGRAQGQVGWGWEHPALVEGVPAYGSTGLSSPCSGGRGPCPWQDRALITLLWWKGSPPMAGRGSDHPALVEGVPAHGRTGL